MIKGTKKLFRSALARLIRSSMANPDQWLVDFFRGGADTYTGKTVDEQNALNYIAVNACVKVLSNSVAQLPLHLYRRVKGGGKERATDHPLYKMMHTAPNEKCSSFVWRQTMQGHLATWGNAFALKETTNGRTYEGFYILRPDRMKVDSFDGETIYTYKLNGTVEYRYNPRQILHIPGFGFDGRVGYSMISLAREAIGLGLAMEEFGARFFGNGAHPGSVAEHPGKLGPQAHDNLKKSLTDAYSGLGKSHKVLILEEGMKWQQIGVPPNDAQFLESRKFQKTEIAGFFQVPPHMIGDLERATFSNIEHQAIDFVTHTMMPWLKLWEQELSRQLLTTSEQDQYFFEFLVDGLLRGDIQSRYTAYSIGRQNGWLSANDVREIENMNPIENGDMYLVPLNMVPADMVGNMGAPEPSSSARHFREVRKLAARDRLQNRFNPLFKAAAQRVINRETIAIKRQIEKHKKNRDATKIKEFINEFYREMPEHIRRELGPVFQSYANSINEQASSEIGKQQNLDDSFQKFVDDYINSYTARHIGSSRGQLEALADDLDDMEQRLDEWDENRSDKIASNETVRGSNAFAQAVFFGAGLSSVWRIRGAKTCPYCQSLDGKRIVSGQAFAYEDDVIEVEGAEPLPVRGLTQHPPLHQGCDCYISAE